MQTLSPVLCGVCSEFFCLFVCTGYRLRSLFSLSMFFVTPYSRYCVTKRATKLAAGLICDLASITID
jgi:hypothetical protein